MVHGRYGYTRAYLVKFLELDRVDVVHKLVENIVDIEFIKGYRTQENYCTLMDTEIPDDKIAKSEMLHYQNSDKVIKVFDLDLQQCQHSVRERHDLTFLVDRV